MHTLRRTRALASAIGFAPVVVAGVLLILCQHPQQAWILLGVTAALYFFWIIAAKGENR